MRLQTVQTYFSLIALAVGGSAAVAQSPPINGIAPSDVRWDAIEHATVLVSPGVQLDDATILMRGGWIEAVGPSATTLIPAGATIHGGRGKRVMAGFIEPALLLDSAAQSQRASTQAGAHWNAYVTPQVSTEDLPEISSKLRGELRQLGFAVAAAYPDTGIFRGRGSVQLLGDAPSGMQKLPGSAGEFLAFGRSARNAPRDDDDDDRIVVYPNSIMGAVALMRQTLHDAKWRAESVAVWNVHPVGNDPPTAAPALDALAPAIAGRERVLFDAATELDALRGGSLAREFGLQASLLGSGTEFRHLNEIVALQLPIIVPLDYPVAPQLTTARLAESASLRELTTWAAAPSNLSRLIAAGAAASLTTARLDQRSDFPQRVREALDAGLTESQLLAALTTTPAALLGLSDTLGTIAVGRMANLTVSDGPLFAKDSRITAVWIAGREYDAAPAGSAPLESEFQFSGRFSVARSDQKPCIMVINPKKSAIEFELINADGSPRSVAAESVALDELRGGFVVDGAVLGLTGPTRCALRIDRGALSVDALSPGGGTCRFVATAAAAAAEEAKKKPDVTRVRPSVVLTQPVGDFGLAAVPTREHVLFRNATVWTSSPDGIRTGTDVLVRDGTITQIGTNLAAPVDGRVIECAGRHLTPGLIDCHSHTGIDGSVNEWTQACTAEVRIGDVIDPDDVGWYRELAGGLTCANQLHGSANPIGGQNSVVKIKWGSPLAEWPATGALPGIKFALGENVVRPKGRYPQTRMGVEAFIRDRFRAAREYHDGQKEYAAHTDRHSREAAPRVDIELEALAEILDSTRIIHCHSYRQDEVVMLISLADEFGFRIGTFQHILEGYKVADAIARHGAGGSCFSDWWAYKIEVMDAIPWAGAMMQGQGVLMSFNSDSSELARHLNTEAAKAVKYGGLSPARALEFVTINPARQLGLGARTGSIEIGKDADLVVWSGDPLSPLSICEQTWVEGTKRFDRSEDLAARAGREALRQQLIVAAMQMGKTADADKPTSKEVTVAPAVGATRLRARMMNMRDDYYLDLWRRGLDLRSLDRAGVCGCDEVSQ
ncbi:MAG: hypothetical protein EXS17_04955 [Phycisphaerales bacterium]|nr:hypothetical protein [Phycisphaerales bacterium]